MMDDGVGRLPCWNSRAEEKRGVLWNRIDIVPLGPHQTLCHHTACTLHWPTSVTVSLAAAQH